MKKRLLVAVYWVWVVVPVLMSIYGLIIYYRDCNSGFRMLTMIRTLFIFVPSTYILTWFIVLFVKRLVADQKIANGVSAVCLAATFIYSLIVFAFFSFPVWIAVSLFFLVLGFTYYSIAELLYEKMDMDGMKE